MNVLADLAEGSLLAFVVALFLVQVLAHELGGAFGRWQSEHGRGGEPESVGLVVGAMLALLGFVLAMTLSFSTTRFQDRQAGTVAEANAISRAWMRAQVIEDPRAGEIMCLLESYGRERRNFVLAPRGDDAAARISAQTMMLEADIWRRFTIVAREQQNALTSALMISLNDAFDASTEVRYTLDVRPPLNGVWLLLGLAVMSIAALGYRMGLRGQSLGVVSSLLSAAWTMVIVVILDLGSPRVGSILTSTAAYDWMLEGFDIDRSTLSGACPSWPTTVPTTLDAQQ